MSPAARIGAVDVLVLGALALLPWFWGGTDLGSTRLVAAVLVVAGAWLALKESTRALFPRSGRPLWIPAAALAVLGVLQAAPLPPGLVAAISPEAARWARESFPVPGAPAGAWLAALEQQAREAVPEAAAPPPTERARPAEGAPPARRWFSLSLAPATTVEVTCWFVALLFAFAVVLERCRDAARFEVYRTAMFALFATLAVVSLANRLSSPSTILWLAAAPPGAKPFGPYVNATHFAGAMELGVPWMMGYSLSRLARGGRPRAAQGPVVLATVGWIVGLAAAIVAASKFAALLLLASSGILLFGAVKGRRAGRVRLVMIGVLLLGVVLVAAGGYLGERIEAFRDIYGGAVLTNDRAQAWKAAAPMVADFWAVGSGLGAFASVFPAYLPAGEAGVWGQAHSDWLELVAGGGLVGLALTAALLAAFAKRLRAAIVAAGPDRGAVVGAALGVGSLTLHALVDFNHQIPANALLFVATAAWVSSRAERPEETSA